MLGAVIGDIVGSVYEFNNYRAKDFAPFFHSKAFFTDDTVCTVAVADALVNERNPAASLKDWGHRYWENGGWGGRFALWLSGDSMEPYGSFGNGAAMRVAPAGLLATTIDLRIADASGASSCLYRLCGVTRLNRGTPRALCADITKVRRDPMTPGSRREAL